jgi:hypothetical protein
MFGQDEFYYEDGTPAPKQEVHGLAHPSIRADKLGANVAFTTTAADKLYKPVFATLCRVEEKADDSPLHRWHIETIKIYCGRRNDRMGNSKTLRG